ncbi:15557_t:CDS:1 [Acaulospora colombiana]|uniref:15557_t:CDS:1 n=1 Tax=Acaulospora colombiana TaxID=27376 RepID=A0ACA9LG41_9GLOM|nr:15557_t:CDS:1 [Acaulospora colombiana]
MTNYEDKLDQLLALFESANEAKLRDSLRCAKGDLERAANIYLEETEKRSRNKHSLKQSTLKLFFHDASVENSEIRPPLNKKRHLNDHESTRDSSEGQNLTEENAKKQDFGKTTNLNEILKWPPSSGKTLKVKARNIKPVLQLYHPHDVSERTPCTLIHDVLPKDLANSLLKVMLKESETWQRNQWWLFERMVTSSHTSSFYTSAEVDKVYDGEVYYNGKRTEGTQAFSPEMEIARKHIKDIVNEKRDDRER